MPRQLKRRRDSYTNEEMGRDDSKIPEGNLTLNDKLVRLQLIKPPWTGGSLIFRPMPCIDYEDPTRLQQGRVTYKPRGQGHWIRRWPAVVGLGIGSDTAPRTTFLMPLKKSDRAKTPFAVFHRACLNASKSGEFGNGAGEWSGKWNKLFIGGFNDSPAIKKKKNDAMWSIQAFIYRNGDQNYLEDREYPLGADQNDPLPVIQLGNSAGEALMSLFDRVNPKFDGDPEETPAGSYMYGDPVGYYKPSPSVASALRAMGIINGKQLKQAKLHAAENKCTVDESVIALKLVEKSQLKDVHAGVVEGGWFIKIFNPKVTKITKRTSFSGTIGKFQGYEAAIVSQLITGKGPDDKLLPDLDARSVNQVFERWQYWSSDEDDPSSTGLLRVLTNEEQAVQIARAFADIPKLVKFSLADHPEWLKLDEVKKILSARKDVAVPGMADEDEGEKSTRRQKPGDDDDDDDDDDGDDDETPARGKKPSRRDPSLGRDDDDDDDGDDDDDDAKPRSGRLSRETADDDGDDDGDGDDAEGEGDEEEEGTPTVEDDDSDDEDAGDDDDDGEAAPVTAEADEDGDDDDAEGDDDEDAPAAAADKDDEDGDADEDGDEDEDDEAPEADADDGDDDDDDDEDAPAAPPVKPASTKPPKPAETKKPEGKPGEKKPAPKPEGKKDDKAPASSTATAGSSKPGRETATREKPKGKEEATDKSADFSPEAVGATRKRETEKAMAATQEAVQRTAPRGSSPQNVPEAAKKPVTKPVGKDDPKKPSTKPKTGKK